MPVVYQPYHYEPPDLHRTTRPVTCTNGVILPIGTIVDIQASVGWGCWQLTQWAAPANVARPAGWESIEISNVPLDEIGEWDSDHRNIIKRS